MNSFYLYYLPICFPLPGFFLNILFPGRYDKSVNNDTCVRRLSWVVYSCPDPVRCVKLGLPKCLCYCNLMLHFFLHFDLLFSRTSVLFSIYIISYNKIGKFIQLINIQMIYKIQKNKFVNRTNGCSSVTSFCDTLVFLCLLMYLLCENLDMLVSLSGWNDRFTSRRINLPAGNGLIQKTKCHWVQGIMWSGVKATD